MYALCTHVCKENPKYTYETGGTESARCIYVTACARGRPRVPAEPARTETVRAPAGAPARRREVQQGEGEGQRGGCGGMLGRGDTWRWGSPRPAPLRRGRCVRSGERGWGGPGGVYKRRHCRVRPRARIEAKRGGEG